MNDTRELIRHLGGTTAVAKKLGVKPNVVCNWHGRGIPWRWRATVEALAKAGGFKTGPDFLGIATKEPAVSP